MSNRGGRRLAWSAFVLWIVFFAVSFAFDLGTKPRPGTTGGGEQNVLFSLMTAVFPVVGILVLARQPRNRIGWILMAIGLGWVVPLGSYGEFALSRGLPGGRLFIALSAPTWALPIGLMGTVLLLRFPDGKLLSARWKKVEWLAAFAISFTVVAVLLAPEDLADVGYPDLPNPLSIEALAPLFNALLGVIFLIPVTIVASAVSLVMRFRRSTGVERLQMKWLTAAAAAVAVIYLAAMLASINAAWMAEATPTWVGIIQTAAVSSFVLVPIAIGFAVLKYRLYDIDLVINKTLVYGALAGFITAVYVGVVVGLGSLVGTGGEPNRALQIAATALVAVAFQPFRERVQRLANRLVYGKRATPYEVMSGFAGQMSAVLGVDEVLLRMAEAAARGVGGVWAKVGLRLPGGEARTVTWPEDAAEAPADRAVPVSHRGQELGEIAVAKSAGDALRASEESLLRDLAAQAGIALHNVRLTLELRGRVEEIAWRASEIHASRQRILAARDEERRRLEQAISHGVERDLHRMGEGLLRTEALLSHHPEQASVMLDGVTEGAKRTLEDLRELARGIYPPLLADAGLVAALEAQAARSTVPVTVDAGGVGRFPEEIEASVYFCFLESLRDATDQGSTVTVRLVPSDSELEFSIEGPQPEEETLVRIRDRVEALGGTVELAGSEVRGTIPAPALEAV